MSGPRGCLNQNLISPRGSTASSMDILRSFLATLILAGTAATVTGLALRELNTVEMATIAKVSIAHLY
jgi:hypothetical protein